MHCQILLAKLLKSLPKNDDPLTMGVKHHCQFDSYDCQVKNDILIQFASGPGEPTPVLGGSLIFVMISAV